MADILLKRIYDPADETDGARILVDRLWPRGISKEKANLTCWLKEIAPSNELRKWFHYDAAPFTEFRSRYLDELRNDEQKIKSVEQVCDMALKGKVTLLYGAKNLIQNHAVIILEEINRKLKEQ